MTWGLFVANPLSFSLTAREFFDSSLWHVHAYFWNHVNPLPASLFQPPPPVPSLSWRITLSLWLVVMMVWCRPCPWLTVCGWEHLECIKNGGDGWMSGQNTTWPLTRALEGTVGIFFFCEYVCLCACVCSWNLLLPVSSMTLWALCGFKAYCMLTHSQPFSLH